MRGMRMSISSTSGACASTAAITSVPSAASPTISRSAVSANIIASPARTSASSSTISSRMLIGPR